jgi:predicted AlkP superfamily pyrophosphatase or phosphodiesterase
MALELWVRASAIGVVLGLASAAELVRLSPDLRSSVYGGVVFASLLVCLYTAVTWGAAAVLGITERLLRRIGTPRGGLVSARFLWGGALVFALHVAINESKIFVEAIEATKLPLRIGLGAGGAALLASAIVRPREAAGAHRTERLLALALLPAVVLAATHYATPAPSAAEPNDTATINLAPRFDAEPQIRPLAVDRPRILVVGLDGASWDRIDRGIAEGRLPTFERLVRRGRRAPLRSFTPTYSPVIWTSIFTGVPGELHGVEVFYLYQVPGLGVQDLRIPRPFDWVEEFLEWTGDLRRVPVTSSLRVRKAVWNLADEAGLGTAVLGLWATWPPERLRHGHVVSDHASLARRYEWLSRRKTSRLTTGVTTHPPELEARLEDLQRSPSSVTREELGRFLPVDDGVWEEFESAERFSKGDPLSVFRSSHLNDAFFLAAADRLWKEERPDLMVVYAKAIDELSHFFYDAGVPEAATFEWSAEEIERYGGVVDHAYAWTDRRLAPLVRAVEGDPGALLVVVSDHGWEKEPDGTYDHNFAPPGVLIVYGADVCTGECPPLGDPSVFDITPTILERLGLPLSEEMRGKPIPAFRTPRQVRRVARYGARIGRARAVASEIDPELNEKLEALGYAD